jgi:nucleotide-binding universal stress UspA family protein
VDAIAGEAERIGREFPDVAVTTESHHGREQAVLFAAAEGASLLVLGAHSRDGLRVLLHGSSALAAAQHAACPVLIVPDPR